MERNVSLNVSYRVIKLVIDIRTLVQITPSHVDPSLFIEDFQSLKIDEVSFRSKEEIGLKNGCVTVSYLPVINLLKMIRCGVIFLKL